MRKTTIGLLVVLTLACLAGSAWMWRRAFPIANVEFHLTREEARVRLQDFVQQLGHSLDGYEHAITFTEDEQGKHFLELEHGLPELEKRTREGLNIWYWSARWFRPAQHEEFTAQLDPQGQLVGFYRTLEEERAAPSLDLAAARALHRSIPAQTCRASSAGAAAVLEESSEQLPHRVDRTLAWERPDFRLGSARYRLEVVVQGDAVGGFREYLEVPESWTRSFAEKRESNDFFESLAGYAAAPLLGRRADLSHPLPPPPPARPAIAALRLAGPLRAGADRQ
jgi:hypothetical protein